jgi:Zinc knuckle
MPPKKQSAPVGRSSRLGTPDRQGAGSQGQASGNTQVPGRTEATPADKGKQPARRDESVRSSSSHNSHKSSYSRRKNSNQQSDLVPELLQELRDLREQQNEQRAIIESLQISRNVTPASTSTPRETRSSNQIKLPNPEKLDNPLRSTGPKWDDWYISMTERLDGSNFDNPVRDKMSYVFGYTQGPARNILSPRYRGDCSGETRFKNHDEMLLALKNVYEDRNRLRKARQAYNTDKMSPGARFSTWNARFVELAGDAQIPQSQWKEDLWDRIDGDLKKQAMPKYKDLDTYEDLVDHLLFQDDELRYLHQNSTPAPNRNLLPYQKRLQGTPGPSTTVTGTIDKEKKPWSVPTPKTSNQPSTSENPDASVKCYNCGEIGHKAPNCPKPRRLNITEIEALLIQYHEAEEEKEAENEET